MSGLIRVIVLLSIFAVINSQYLLPIHRHEPTNQFFTTFNVGYAVDSPVNLLLDLGTNFTWLNCRTIKSLSSMRLITCQNPMCKAIPGNACAGKYCLSRQQNPLTPNTIVTGRVVQDKAFIFATNGRFFDSEVSLPRFTFSCAGQKALKGLPPPVEGVVVSGVLSLAPVPSSFTNQVTTAFNIIPKFSLCLPSSGTGHFYVAGIHYFISPFLDSNRPIPMSFTPMKGIESGDYLIGVESIYVGGTPLSLSPNLLTGGAKLSTVVPYTVLHTDIYNAIAQSFTLKAKAMGISKVPSVAPFKHCFDSRATGKKLTGPNVPVIEMGLPGRMGQEKWAFYGASTVVNMKKTVMCLAFIDGGNKPHNSMVIGTHQLQDYLIEFDFSRTMFAFSDSLLLYNSSCSTWY